MQTTSATTIIHNLMSVSTLTNPMVCMLLDVMYRECFILSRLLERSGVCFDLEGAVSSGWRRSKSVTSALTCAVVSSTSTVVWTSPELP